MVVIMVLNWCAIDITNRIMRRENYLIALINMNRLDFSIPFINQCRPTPPATTDTLQPADTGSSYP